MPVTRSARMALTSLVLAISLSLSGAPAAPEPDAGPPVALRRSGAATHGRRRCFWRIRTSRRPPPSSPRPFRTTPTAACANGWWRSRLRLNQTEQAVRLAEKVDAPLDVPHALALATHLAQRRPLANRSGGRRSSTCRPSPRPPDRLPPRHHPPPHPATQLRRHPTVSRDPRSRPGSSRSASARPGRTTCWPRALPPSSGNLPSQIARTRRPAVPPAVAQARPAVHHAAHLAHRSPGLRHRLAAPPWRRIGNALAFETLVTRLEDRGQPLAWIFAAGIRPSVTAIAVNSSPSTSRDTPATRICWPPRWSTSTGKTTRLNTNNSPAPPLNSPTNNPPWPSTRCSSYACLTPRRGNRASAARIAGNRSRRCSTASTSLPSARPPAASNAFLQTLPGGTGKLPDPQQRRAVTRMLERTYPGPQPDVRLEPLSHEKTLFAVYAQDGRWNDFARLLTDLARATTSLQTHAPARPASVRCPTPRVA